MTSTLKIDTRSVNPVHRLAYWNENVGGIYGGMTVDSNVSQFLANLTYIKGGQVGFMRARSVQSLVSRKGNNHQAETLLLHLQAQGESINTQGRQSVCLKPGDFTLCENRSAYTIETSASSDVIALEVPYAIAKAYVPDIESKIITPYSTQSLYGRLLFATLQTLQAECDLRTASEDELVGLQHLLMEQLAKLISVAGDAAAVPAKRDSQLLAKVKAIIQRYLSDDNLGTEQLAQEVGVSERRIQTLFAESGTTPTAYIRTIRLEWAAQRLRYDPSMPITQIAYDAGFSDSAYFSRCFRNVYGVTPKQYRSV